MVETAELIWASGPASAPSEPDKTKIRQWGTWLESIVGAFTSNGGLIYDTRVLLYADLAKPANTMAWVIGDSTAAYNGVYKKVGASGSGSWTRVADLPYSFIVASDVGAGTANAIVATSALPISGSALVLLNIAETNTGSPVTVAFNGGVALTVKDYMGDDIVAGELRSGMRLLGIVSGSTFRLLFDQKMPFVRAVNAGTGTANAIEASISAGVDFSEPDHLIALNVTAANTSTSVTVSLNGGQPLFVKTNSGNNPPVGGLVSGMVLLGLVSGSEFHLLSDVASAAIQAAAEAAAEAAADYADFARNNWAIAARFTGTGNQEDYPLSIDPGSENNMWVTIGGLSQEPGGDTPPWLLVYSGGDAFIRTTAPLGEPGVVRVSNAIDVGVPSDGSVTGPKIATAAVDTSKLTDGAATFAKIQDIAASRVLGRVSGGSGDVEELTASQLLDLVFPAGSVVSSVTAIYTANASITGSGNIIPADDTIPQITEGLEILSVAITPKSASNKIRVRVAGIGGIEAVGLWSVAAFRNGQANAIGSVPMVTNNSSGYWTTFSLDADDFVAGSTSPMTISVRAGPGGSSNTLRFNGSPTARYHGGTAGVKLTVEEIKG